MPFMDEEGVFRAKPITWQLKPATDPNSRSVALKIAFKIGARYDPALRDWVEYPIPYEYDAEGWFYVVKRDGTRNERTIETLKNVFGWDGKAISLTGNRYMLPECSITMAFEDYKGQRQCRIKWLNPAGQIGSDQGANIVDMVQAAIDGKPLPPAVTPPPPPPPQAGVFNADGTTTLGDGTIVPF